MICAHLTVESAIGPYSVALLILAAKASVPQHHVQGSSDAVAVCLLKQLKLLVEQIYGVEWHGSLCTQPVGMVH